MTLITSISGIRGTIGGFPSQALTPVDIVKYTAAYAIYLKQSHEGNLSVVVGRDARISGTMVSQMVNATLNAMGINVIDAGLSTTPTVEMAVVFSKSQGGIVITASHNNKEWNALKLLNSKGEFISSVDGNKIIDLAMAEDFLFSTVDTLGKTVSNDTFLDKHIKAIVSLPLVDIVAIKKANFKIVVDAVNSSGGIAVPKLLEALGVSQVEKLYCHPNGVFPHNPEPLPEHLGELSNRIVTVKADLGFVVDPDVDRLAIVNQDGTMFGEEYTLVAVAEYILKHTKGATVSNLSSTSALKEITQQYNQKYYASAVGEVNVVEKMKEFNAVIGGEGNGGIIYPKLHYGRDALVGIALFLSHLASSKFSTCSVFRASFPDYFISKNKVTLSDNQDIDKIIKKVAKAYKDKEQDSTDGLKIYFQNQWAHLRKSNTEPIIRIYTEAATFIQANDLAKKVISVIAS